MDILLVYKWGYDPDDLFVRPDGTHKFVRGKLSASDDDAAAVISARETAVATDGKLTGVTIGSGDAGWVLAREAQEATVVEDYTYDTDDALTASRLVKAIEAAGKPDLVVMGDEARFAGVAGCVAAKMGLPLVAGLDDFSACSDDASCIIAHRRTASGIETLKVRTPALVTVAATESEQQPPTMKKILAARKLPTTKVDAATLGAIAESKAKAVAVRVPEKRMARMFEGTPAEMADSLVAALKADQIL